MCIEHVYSDPDDGGEVTVWFPDFLTEAHRTAEHQTSLVGCLAFEGIQCIDSPNTTFDLIFCGTIWKASEVRDFLKKSHVHHNTPVIHYNWDIYPFQVERYSSAWLPYFADLRQAARVLVPSEPTVRRTQEYAGTGAQVCLSSFHPWGVEDLDDKVTDKGYVVNVMRPYANEPNESICRRYCRDEGIPLQETRCEVGWDQFRQVIAGARLLVSAYHEASTGGLTLLEGYWHGKPLLLADSPRNGVSDYFPKGHGLPGVRYFRWDDPNEFRTTLREMFDQPLECPSLSESLQHNRKWLMSNYGEQAFARRLAYHFREVLKGGSS